MRLPELHLADWRPTKDTLHLYCQIVGKVRLATTPPRNHWWNSPEPDGLRDQPLPLGDWVAAATGSLAVLPYDAVPARHATPAELCSPSFRRLRSGRQTCRMGHERLRVQMVSDPEPAPTAASNCGARPRATRLAGASAPILSPPQVKEATDE
jgi:hypothetical protein